MRQFKVTHDAKAVLVVWWCLVTIGSGLMAVDETAALENAKTIKVEKLLTLIRVSESYFQAMGIPLVAGHPFTGMTESQSPFEVIVSGVQKVVKVFEVVTEAELNDLQPKPGAAPKT